MEKYIVEGTHKTPRLMADPDNGIIEIRGRSNPENSAEFYRPLIEWLDAYIENDFGNAEITIDLEQFNTSSSKCLMDVLKRLKKLNETGRNVVVYWYYEEDDEEMLEVGETYESMTNLNFNKIEKPISEL